MSKLLLDPFKVCEPIIATIGLGSHPSSRGRHTISAGSSIGPVSKAQKTSHSDRPCQPGGRSPIGLTHGHQVDRSGSKAMAARHKGGVEAANLGRPFLKKIERLGTKSD